MSATVTRDLAHADPAAIADDLRRRVEGEVLCDAVSRTLYSTAACIYQVQPLGAVVPRHEADVLAVLDYARRHGIPVTARGGGSGLAGQTLGQGLILDLSRHLTGIGAVDPEALTVRAQPGVIAARLNRAIASRQIQFAPDPSSSAWCTLGGMIANNAGGSHTIQHGATRDNVVSLRVALASGQVIETAPGAPDPTGARTRLQEGVRRIVTARREVIQARQPRTKRNSSGYALREMLEGAGAPVDLAPLIAGSEGTLGIVLDATLRLVPMAKARATALVLFDDLEKSGAGVVEVLRARPAAVELLDRTFVEVIREADPERGASLPDGTEAILIVELQGDDPAEVASRLATLEHDLVGRRRLAFEVRTSTRPEEMARIWAIRKAASPILSRREGRLRNTRFIEDAAVHPERMADFVRALRALLDRYGLKAAIFGHAGDCNLHCNPLMNPKDPRDLRKMEDIAAEFTDLVIGLGGSLSGEHGDGRLRTPFLERAYGDLVGVFREVKTLFDPEGLLNPGIIVHDGRARLTDDLRYGAAYRRVPTTTPIDGPDWQREIEKCHGCGACRDYCPVAADSGEEAATARAKGNLLRAVISGRLAPEAMATAPFKAVMDLCVNCRLCHTECPTAIDIPGMAVLAKEVYVRARGKRAADRVLTASGPLLRAGTATAPFANALLNFAPARRALEVLTGVAARRRMTPFASQALAPRVPSVDPGGRRVAYFHGCFGGYQDVDGEGRATLEALEALGVTVAVPAQECCGIAAITQGHLDDVRPAATRNVAVFVDLLRRGYTPVYSAPSCGIALVEDYPRLLGVPQADLLARNVQDVHAYALGILRADAAARARLRPVPVRLTYHDPCHSKSRGAGGAVVDLLNLIPGVTVIPIEQDHCCGIAGTYGMKACHFDRSMAIGGPLFESIARTGAPVVATGCGTCKMQIEQGSGRPVVHPMRLLRDALTGGARADATIAHGDPRTPAALR